jgi:hypothetical protein
MSDLPRYQCIKIVRAAKITNAQAHEDGGGTLYFDEIGNGVKAEAEVTFEWVEKRVPGEQAMIGGYYVEYEDGYTSWSPAEAFEAGYVRVAE